LLIEALSKFDLVVLGVQLGEKATTSDIDDDDEYFEVRGVEMAGTPL